MKYLNKFESFKLYETEMVCMPANLSKFKKDFEESPEESISEYEKVLGRKGELSKHLQEQGKKFTFGMLKYLFNDALEYKKKRELIKGGYKMFHRLVPMALSMVYFPVALVGYILGASRAFDKVIMPVLENPDNKYNDFLVKIVKGAIAISEGEIKHIMEDDWFYNAFVMDDNLIRMVRPEILRTFAHELAHKMELEPEDNEVPHNYIENEFKMYLNEKFSITPPMGLEE